jgi:hypothetical protein
VSKYRNISGGELDLRAPGFERVVAADEVVDIPDFQPDGESPIVVPPDKWEPVAEPKVAPEKASKSKAAV